MARRTAEERLTPKDYLAGVSQREALDTLKLRKKAFWAILVSFVGLLLFTCGVILLQGFGWRGFRLDESSVKWLGGTVMVQLVGVLVIVVRALFKRFGDK